VLIDNFKLVERGRFREKELIELLTDHPYPARNHPECRRPEGPDRRQRKGRRRTEKDGRHFGLDVVEAYMNHVQDNAEESVRRVIETLSDCEYEYPTDNGQVIKVKITVDREARGHRRFHRHLDAMENNFNAPEPVARAAVLYCFRVMVEKQHPDECRLPQADPHRHPRRLRCSSRPIRRGGRRQCRDEPARDQRHLLARLGALANSQGTMNNLTFGNDKYQYYETICSGSPPALRIPAADSTAPPASTPT
jgi:5-oxoprolinase (ATP-hydrolysing)